MFPKVSPESIGLSSRDLQAFLQSLEDNGLVMHSALFLRGQSLFGEFYWNPFDENFCHRMYSQTKSFVGVAIGFLEEERKISLDDPIALYFLDKMDDSIPPFLANQTIRHMLTMTTSAQAPYWFHTADPDRTHEYLNASDVVRPSNSLWGYDTHGSQVLASLVERVSGKSLFTYLEEKLFRHLGTFQTASILKTPNGDSWGDSAMLCTGRDMLSFARFVMDGGVWQGKRLLNATYLEAATARQKDNQLSGFAAFHTHGYGYQIWRHPLGGFSFHGMGGQFTFCFPEQDLIFTCTGDNQGYPAAPSLLFDNLRQHVIAKLSDPLPEDPVAQAALASYGESLQLAVAQGARESSFAAQLSGKKYVCDKNPMGIRSFYFDFQGDRVLWHYENAQGGKTLPLGLGYNLFGPFPQYGYSDGVGGERSDGGFCYHCAASAAWLEEQKLGLRVQIIDRYFGNFFAVFAFRDHYCAVRMIKCAEDFLQEYEGELLAKCVEQGGSV